MNSDYYKLNWIFVILLLLFFIGVSIIDMGDVPSCQRLVSTGEFCSSCGLSRDFKSFMKLDFSAPMNTYSISVFLWMGIQLIGRGLLIAVNDKLPKRIAFYDVIITTLSGLTVFGQFWI